MKKMFRLYFFCLIALTFHIGASHAADWRHYAEDSEGNFLYYDQDSIAEIKGITSVWQKKVYTSNNLFRIRQILGERYYKLMEKITLFEIHCPTRQAREKAFAYYDSNDKFIAGNHDLLNREWRKIVSGTDMVILYRICCEKGEKKSQPR